MSKNKHHKRIWVGKVKHQEPEIWIPEDQIQSHLDFVNKLHPGDLEDPIKGLEELGYISIRTSSTGKREFRLNRGTLQAALDKLPPEIRDDNREIIVRESMAKICDYNNHATTLLSVAEQQSRESAEKDHIVPWLTRTHEQMIFDTMGIVDDIPDTLAWLEQKNYLEVAENGPDRYRYRLNIPVIQSAIDALPSNDEGGEA